jgi:hypothetical protein
MNTTAYFLRPRIVRGNDPSPDKQEIDMTKLNNETRELNFNELDQVSGGDVGSWVLGFVAGKVAEAILKATDSTPTNVLNGMLGAIGHKPV